ncbi:MAG: hypothetical protein ACFCUU_17180 [Cyclobacteriaceae bacterium]
MKPFKTLLAYLLIITLIITSSCNEDEENLKPDIQNPTDNRTNTFTKEDIRAEGKVDETTTGYLVNGKVTLSTDSIEIEFEDADLEVAFNEDGTLKTFEGKALVPSSEKMFTLENPIKADVNFYTGRYINENFDIEIRLVDDISYFLFYIKVESELNMTIAGEPVTLPNPLGAHITLVSDFNDPMFFFSVGAEIKGSLAFGQSNLGQIPFMPTSPVANIISFNAKSVRGMGMGSSSFGDKDSNESDNNADKDKNSGDGKDKPKSKKKGHKFTQFISAYGMLYQNTELGSNIDWENPQDAELTAGYRSGLNGELSLSFPGMEFPVGQGSFAAVTEASSKSGIIAKGFFHGIVDPDMDWWPKFIPLKPDGRLSVDGYTTSEGEFDFGLAGAFGIELPDGTYHAEGELRSAQKVSIIGGVPAVENLFAMEGSVINGDEVWGAKAIFTDDSTLYIASPPDGFLDGVSEMVTHQVDSAFAIHEKALEDLKKAAEDYEIELSLRGLKNVIPEIVDNALSIIDESVEDGVAKGIQQANQIANSHNADICSNNVRSTVNSIVKPYKDALNRLKASINKTHDTDQSRIELEQALRDLIMLKKIDKTITININWAYPSCNSFIKLKTGSETKTIRINRTVIAQEYVDQLTLAADNVKYIKEASDYKIKAQQLVDLLPSIEDLNYLKGNINGCITEIVDNIGEVGFVKNHKTGEYKYFMMVNGKRTEVSGFNVFDSQSTIEVAMPEFNLCSFDK